MFGYCAIGMTQSASSPASTMTIEMTSANFGRWMKKELNTPAQPPFAAVCAWSGWMAFGRLRSAGRCDLRVDDLAGPHLLHALHDHVFAGGQSLADDVFLPDLPSELDRALCDLVIRPDDEDKAAGLIGLDRGDRREHRFFRFGGPDIDGHVAARQQQRLGVREIGIDRDGSGLRVRLVVDERDLAGTVIFLAVRQHDLQRESGCCLLHIRPDPLLEIDKAAVRDRKHDADRVHLIDRRERRGGRRNEVAFGQRDRAEPPGNRRGDRRIAEIELRLGQRGLGAENVGLGLVAVGPRDVQIGGRLVTSRRELSGALILPLRIGQRRICRSELRLGGLHRGLVLRLLQHEQNLPGLDVAALRGRLVLDKGGNAGHDLDGLDRLHMPDKARYRRDVFDMRRGHDDRGRRLVRRLLAEPVSSRKCHGQRHGAGK